MSTPFKIFVKARGREGVFHVSISALSAIIAGAFSVGAFVYGGALPWFTHALLLGLAGVAARFFVRAVVDIRRAREWEFTVDDDRLLWLSRDRSNEEVECEIFLRDIRALIYRPGDSEVGAYLDVEFLDDSVKRLPLVGVPSENSLLAFINYWRDAHADIPIRNLENAN
jgi:hypothetical protein